MGGPKYRYARSCVAGVTLALALGCAGSNDGHPPSGESSGQESLDTDDQSDDDWNDDEMCGGATGGPRCSEESEGDEHTSDFVPKFDILCGGEGGDESAPDCTSCTPYLQDCKEGEKCTLVGTDDPGRWYTCVPVMGAGESGDPCMSPEPQLGDDDCAKGAICSAVDPNTGVGVCVGFCSGSEADPSCDEGQACAVFDGALPVCLATCDPLAGAAACPLASDLCVPAPDSEAFVCVPPDGEGGGYGQGCETSAQCAAGLLCVPGVEVPGCGDDNCCTEYCDLEAPEGDDQCAGVNEGQQCNAVFPEDPPVGYEDLGVCSA